MKKFRGILSALLCALLIFTAVQPVFADEAPDRGKIGDNIFCFLSSDGTLTIEGTGRMYSWENKGSPFSGNGKITKVIVKEGVENIGSYAFYKCTALKDIRLPLTVREIGAYAFGSCKAIEDICIPDSTGKIGVCAFKGDTALKNIYMGVGIEAIEDGAFADCGKIENIFIRDEGLFSSADSGKKEGQESFFEAVHKVIKTGDADLDGSISAADARIILRYSVGLEDILNAPFCDTDKDSNITSADARLILRKSVGMGKCRFHTFTKKEVTLPDGTKELHRICIDCGRDTDAIPEITGQMGKKFADIFSYYGAMSAGVGIVEDGEVTGTYSYGWADRNAGLYLNSDTKLRAASTSKLIVCITFMAMKDAGLVDDHTDISEYLGYKCRNPYYPDDIITPSMIMTHSSSINGGYSNGGTYYLPDYALSTYAPYWQMRPGSMYEYCNAGLGVLACIMEKVSGKYLSELTREYIFDKMGIDAAFDAAHLSDPDKVGCLSWYGTREQVKNIVTRDLGHSLNLAPGNLLISPKDYARVLAMLINDGRAEDGTVIITPERVEEIEKIRIYEDYADSPGSYGVGYGVQLEDTVLPGKNVMVHIGSGRGIYSTYIYNPEDRSGIYIMTTGCAYNLDPDCEVYRVCLDTVRAYYSFMENKS